MGAGVPVWPVPRAAQADAVKGWAAKSPSRAARCSGRTGSLRPHEGGVPRVTQRARGSLSQRRLRTTIGTASSRGRAESLHGQRRGAAGLPVLLLPLRAGGRPPRGPRAGLGWAAGGAHWQSQSAAPCACGAPYRPGPCPAPGRPRRPECACALVLFAPVSRSATELPVCESEATSPALSHAGLRSRTGQPHRLAQSPALFVGVHAARSLDGREGVGRSEAVKRRVDLQCRAYLRR